jgi:hypothetical protein
MLIHLVSLDFVTSDVAIHHGKYYSAVSLYYALGLVCLKILLAYFNMHFPVNVI